MMRGAKLSASRRIHSASCGKCLAAASITRTLQPRARSDAATYSSPSSGEPSCSGEGGLMSRTLIAAPPDEPTLDGDLAEARPGEYRPRAGIVADRHRPHRHVRRREGRSAALPHDADELGEALPLLEAGLDPV